MVAAIYAAIGLFALYRMTRRAAVPLEEQGHYVILSPRGTTVAAGLAAEEAIDAEHPAPEANDQSFINR